MHWPNGSKYAYNLESVFDAIWVIFAHNLTNGSFLF